MARTGRIEGGAVRPAASRIRGCRRVAWEPGSRNATGVALPARVSARPPAFAGVIVVRGGFPLRVRGCLRADSGRRAGRGGVGVVLDPGPLGSAAFVRASFSARRDVRLGCRNCSVRPVRAGFSGTCGVRLGGGPGRSARCDRQDDLLGGRGVRLVPGNESLHSRSRSAAFKRASCSARKVFDSLPGNGGRSTLGAGSRGRSARWRSCGRSFSAREVFDSVSANGSFHLVAICRPLRSEAVQQPVGVSGIAARLELPEPDERRHAGVDRFVSRCSSSRRSAGGTPLGGCGASIWRSASTGASVQRLGGARPQPQRRIPPSRRQPA